MTTHRWTAFFLMTVLSLMGAPVGAQEDESKASKLEGFSRKAEAEIEKMLSALHDAKSYSDEGVIQYSAGGVGAGMDMEAAFTLERPNKFHFKGRMHEIVSDGKQLIIATSDGLLSLLTLQPAGKRHMTAEEFLRGYPVREGDIFGPSL